MIDSYKDIRSNKTDVFLLYITQILLFIGVLRTQAASSSFGNFLNPSIALISSIGFLLLFTKISGDMDISKIKKICLRTFKLCIYLSFYSLISLIALLATKPFSNSNIITSSTEIPSISSQVFNLMFSINSLSQLTLICAFFSGSYLIANGRSLSNSIRQSIIIFAEKPIKLGLIIVISTIAVYIPLIIFATPGVFITQMINIYEIKIPLTIFILTLGTSMGGYISLRFVPNWLENQNYLNSDTKQTLSRQS